MSLDERERRAAVGVVLVFAAVSGGSGAAILLSALGPAPDVLDQAATYRPVPTDPVATALVAGVLVGASLEVAGAVRATALGVALGYALALVVKVAVLSAVVGLAAADGSFAGGPSGIVLVGVESTVLGVLGAVASSRLHRVETPERAAGAGTGP